MSNARSPWFVPGLLALAILALAGGSVLVASDYHSPEPSPNATLSETTLPETHTGTLEPLQTPEKPENLTRENVGKFVERTEYVQTYNRHREGMDEISVECEANVTLRTDEGFYAVAACGGYASNDEVHADFGSTAILYFVNESETIRIDRPESRHRPVDERYAADDPAENVNPPNQSAEGFRVYNFADREYALSVNVTYLNESSPERALSATYELEPRTGIEQDDVTVRRGAYRIAVRSETGEALTHRWTVDGSRGYSWSETAILVTPTGELLVVELPVFGLGPV